MNMLPQTVQEIKEYFNAKLIPAFDKEEVKHYCLLSLEKYLNISRAELRLKADMPIQEDVARRFIGIVEELLTSKPIQYILGETEFFGCKINVDENVLIPRQETEELVDWIIKDVSLKYKSIKEQSKHEGNATAELNAIQTVYTILDIGTGSGCIPIALKKNLSFAKLYALDISEAALKLAKLNALSNGEEVNFYQGNILEIDADSFSKENGLILDCIVSNPPYVLHSESKLIQANVVDYEPHLALFVEDSNPLVFYEAIANFALSTLKPGGKLYFEINEAYGTALSSLLNGKGFSDVKIRKDLNGKDRMCKATRM
jgi:release factor glutamine methyltransferase